MKSIITIAACVLCWFGGYGYGKRNQTPTDPHNAITKIAETMPPATKANLLAVAGAYASDSDLELLELIMPWCIKKRDELLIKSN